MSLDKNKTIAAIGRRTRLRNHDVQRMLETLIEVWGEELASGGRIEIENFLVLQVKHVKRGLLQESPRIIRQLSVRPSRRLRRRMGL